MRIGAATRDRLLDSGGEGGLVVRVHGRDDLLQAEAVAGQRGIEAEGARKRVVDGEAIVRQIPEPGADDRARSESASCTRWMFSRASASLARSASSALRRASMSRNRTDTCRRLAGSTRAADTSI